MARPLAPSLDFERALRLSASAHRGQVRKGSDTPYIEHPVAVALILDRAGFDESVAIAGLLHDLVEDTDVTLPQLADRFGDRVAGLVEAASVVKLDASGLKRPWIDRKRDQIAAMAAAPAEAKGLVLADKLHNLLSIRLDLLEGRPVWESFHAGRDDVLWYYGAMIDACRSEDSRVEALGLEARGEWDALVSLGPRNREISASEG